MFNHIKKTGVYNLLPSMMLLYSVLSLALPVFIYYDVMYVLDNDSNILMFFVHNWQARRAVSLIDIMSVLFDMAGAGTFAHHLIIYLIDADSKFKERMKNPK